MIDKYLSKKENIRKYNLYNIGNSTPVSLMAFIKEIEKNLEVEATKELLPLQLGDVKRTWADVEALKKDFDYCPETKLEKGISSFIIWYKEYFNL